MAALIELGGDGQPGRPEPTTATVARTGGRAALAAIHPSAKARSTIASSICSIVTGSSLIASTHDDSHGAGQISP